MTKAVLNDFVNLENQTSVVNIINANNAVIETAFENTLSRDGTSPNQMEASLDMNSHRILNLPYPISTGEPVRLIDLNTFSGGPLVIDPLPTGGTAGQILQKNSSTNYDVSWINGNATSRGFVSIKDSGAKGDGIRKSASLIIASGSALLTATGATFTSADVGKSILVPGAGVAGADLTTTIVAFNTISNVTLATTASTSLATTGTIVYGTDDTSAITAAQAAAVAGHYGLVWPSGNYVTTSTLDFSSNNSCHTNLGGATICFIGTGRALKFDGGSGFLFNITFGTRESPFYLIGNSKATTLVYANRFEHSNLNVIASECSSNPVTVETSVLSKFYIECSVNSTPMVTIPTIGLSGNNTNYCDFEVIIEGIHGNGIEVINSHYCTFKGTCEGNTGGGVYVGTGCYSNIFYNLDCEANTGIDWFLDGDTTTTLYNCQGGSSITTNLRIDGSGRPRIIQGGYNVITINGATAYGYLEGIDYTTLTNLSATTMYQRIYNGVLSDYLKRPSISAPTLQGGWFNYGAGFRGSGYWQDAYGMVHLTGVIAGGVSGTPLFTLPVGMRPSSSLTFNYVNALDSTQGTLSISSGGVVNHGSGTTTFVSLDGASFLAE